MHKCYSFFKRGGGGPEDFSAWPYPRIYIFLTPIDVLLKFHYYYFSKIVQDLHPPHFWDWIGLNVNSYLSNKGLDMSGILPHFKGIVLI